MGLSRNAAYVDGDPRQNYCTYGNVGFREETMQRNTTGHKADHWGSSTAAADRLVCLDRSTSTIPQIDKRYSFDSRMAGWTEWHGHGALCSLHGRVRGWSALCRGFEHSSGLLGRRCRHALLVQIRPKAQNS